MTLAKALKVKNRLAGQLAKLRQQAQVGNSRLETQPVPSVRVDKVWTEQDRVEKELLDLKVAIAQATAPIVDKLIRIAEVKAKIAFLALLPVNEAVRTETIGYGANQTVREVKFINFYTEKDRQEMVAGLTSEVEKLQDEIDEFNAVTKIAA